MSELSQQERERVDFLAKLANSSYEKPERRPKYDVNYGFKDRGLIYDGDASDKYHAVYLDPKNNKVYVSIRGTQLNRGFGESASDLLDDVAVGVGAPAATRRYKDSEKKYLDLKKKYPDMEIELVSHSLGGSVASELTKKYGVASHNFNTGSGVIRPETVYGSNFGGYAPDYKTKTHYYNTDEFDILSETSKIRPGVHHIYSKKDDKSPHSLSNFFLASAEK
jgi:hypothetical protein